MNREEGEAYPVSALGQSPFKSIFRLTSRPTDLDSRGGIAVIRAVVVTHQPP